MKKIKIMKFNRRHFREEAIIDGGKRMVQGPFRNAIPHPNTYYKQMISGIKIPFRKK